MPNLMKSTAVLVCAAALLWSEPLTSGTYKGKWEGATASGDFRVTLAKGEAGKWTAEVSFGLSGQDVKCKVTSVQVDGAKLKIVYQFDLQGTALESMLDGEIKETRLGGKYRTQVVGDGTTVDEGTWTTTSGA